MSRILVVDDSEQSLNLLRKILSDEGHEVHLAKEAFEAMDYLDRFSFDLMLLDVNMPFKDGFSTLKSLKETIRFKMMPIAMITGRSEPRDVKKAISLGADSYIVKPFEKADILPKINKLLNKENTKISYQLEIGNTSPFAGGALSMSSDIRIQEVTDSSVMILTDMPLQQDKDILLNCPVFERLGIPSQKMKISDTKKYNDKMILARLIYKSIQPENIQKLRNWILSQKNTKRMENAG
ncbi:MAG: response regulator [Bdellovibrionota bacterium]|nr:response regulator [Bdellovibrionota bacterium]